MKRGMCKTEGTSNDVLPFFDHQQIIPGRIYYGLDFTDRSYSGTTCTPHPYLDPDPISDHLPCQWGGGKKFGRCVSNGKAHGDDVQCPSTQRQIVHAWQQCAEFCNDQEDCHTFTVKTSKPYSTSNYLNFDCYFHKSYGCISKNNQYAGIDNYENQNTYQQWGNDQAGYDDLGVWSGICRTRYNSKVYACSNTPIPKCGQCANYRRTVECCNDGGAFDRNCLGCNWDPTSDSCFEDPIYNANAFPLADSDRLCWDPTDNRVPSGGNWERVTGDLLDSYKNNEWCGDMCVR